MRNNLILSLLLFFALPLKGAKLSGIVTDNKNVPLPFVIVYVSVQAMVQLPTMKASIHSNFNRGLTIFHFE